jgi:hypothetical protein
LQKNILLKLAVTNHILVGYKMKKFFKELWECWKATQEARAEFYAKHGNNCWE